MQRTGSKRTDNKGEGGEERLLQRRGRREKEAEEWRGGGKRKPQGDEKKRGAAWSGEEEAEEQRPVGGEGAESDLRAEHRAVVVDEAGADELVSRLSGSEAQLDDSLLSCNRRGDEETGQNTKEHTRH